MSISAGYVERDVHEAWFQRVLSDPQRALFIGLTHDDGAKIGMCRFDLAADGKQAEVSINLNPAIRGKGWAKPLLREAMFHYGADNPVALTATVKRHNAAAARCFLACGFHLRAEDDDYLYFLWDPCQPHKLITDIPCR